MIYKVIKHTGFYLQLSVLLIAALFIFFLINNDGSFSGSQNQQFSPGMNFIFINYSFLGDCIFAFTLSVFLIVVLKKQMGVQLFFAALFTFIIIQVIENGASPESVTLHFELWQNIYPGNKEADHHLISFNTAMMLTLCAVSAKYTNSKWKHLFLLVAVLLMAFCRIYLVQEAVWNILLAMPVSFAAFIAAEILMDSKRTGIFFKKASTLTNEKQLPFSFH